MLEMGDLECRLLFVVPHTCNQLMPRVVIEPCLPNFRAIPRLQCEGTYMKYGGDGHSCYKTECSVTFYKHVASERGKGNAARAAANIFDA